MCTFLPFLHLREIREGEYLDSYPDNLFVYHVCRTDNHKYKEIPLCIYPLHKLLTK